MNIEWCKSYVVKNSGTIEDAEDLFQSCIHVAWVNLKTGKFVGSQEKFNAYLRQICKYKWINILKTRKPTSSINEDRNDYSEGNQQDENWEENEIQTNLLIESLMQLGEGCREILSRFYFKKSSLKSIASTRNTTEKSIKTIKFRCMNKLRKTYLELQRKHE